MTANTVAERVAPIGLTTCAAMHCDEVLVALDSRSTGLTSTEAAARLRTIGPNVVASRNVTLGGVLLRQL